ncbi:MAG: hypothetical protein AB7O67_05645 [Vicinamibacterales bacterium]
MMRSTLSFVVAALLLAAPAGAQQVSLQIKDGLVSLQATNAPVSTIMREWQRVGDTRVVNVDKITGAPLTLTLEQVPEREALAIVLRNVAGYMAAPRPIANTGNSVFDRIVVLASSSAPAGPPPGAASSAARSRAGTQRFVPPRPPFIRPPAGVVDDQQDAPDDQYLQPGEQPEDDQNDPSDVGGRRVFTFPQPGQAQEPGEIAQPAEGGNVTPPVITLQPDPNGGPPQVISVQPGMPNETAPQQPANGFQIIGSPTPGVIQQPTPGQPVRRPPGQ